MEVRRRVRKVLVQDGWALVKVVQVPDRPGIAHQVFGRLAAASIPVGLILQNASVERMTDLSFTVRSEHAGAALALMRTVQGEIGGRGVELIEDLAVVQLVGTGILTDPSTVGRLFRVLADAGVNILAIGTSEVRISCLVNAGSKQRALEALNEAFQPDEPVGMAAS